MTLPMPWEISEIERARQERERRPQLEIPAPSCPEAAHGHEEPQEPRGVVVIEIL